MIGAKSRNYLRGTQDFDMRLIYLTVFFLYTLLGNAQETWDLEKCINYAIDNSIAVKQADLSVEDASVLKKMNEQQRLPSLNGNANAFSNFGRTIDPTSNEFVTANFFSNSFSLNAGLLVFRH